jgi:hypothetical protein
MPYPLRGIKTCSQCGLRKPWDAELKKQSQFPIRRRQLKSGGDRLYPAGECKECNSKRAAAHREKLRREGTLSQKQKQWNESREPEHRREYQREYQTIQRRQAGVPARGPWTKYRKTTRVMLNAEPLLRYLEDLDMSLLHDNLQHVVRRARQNGHLELSSADALLLALGAEHMMVALYGDVPTR